MSSIVIRLPKRFAKGWYWVPKQGATVNKPELLARTDWILQPRGEPGETVAIAWLKSVKLYKWVSYWVDLIVVLSAFTNACTVCMYVAIILYVYRLLYVWLTIHIATRWLHTWWRKAQPLWPAYLYIECNYSIEGWDAMLLSLRLVYIPFLALLMANSSGASSRLCPLDRYCPDGYSCEDSTECVDSCYTTKSTSQGNGTTGRCEDGKYMNIAIAM